MNKQDYIGVFDSGVGGLSILTKLLTDFPNESFIYLGDTARLPYGTKSKDTIKKYVKRNIKYLILNYPIKAIVVACNSASSVLNEIDLPVKTIGVIKAGAHAALNKTKTNHIGLWATRTTVSLKKYDKEVLSLNPKVKLTSVSCPTLVALVEEMGSLHPLLNITFDYYLLDILQNPKIDTLILGCTHFPFFKDRLKEHMKSKNIVIKIVDSSEKITVQLRNLLKDSLSFNKKLKDQILITDEAAHFKDFILKVMPEKHPFFIKKIDI